MKKLFRKLPRFVSTLFLSCVLSFSHASCYVVVSSTLLVGGGIAAALSAILFALGGGGKGDSGSSDNIAMSGFVGFGTTDGAITGSRGGNVNLVQQNIIPTIAPVVNNYTRLRSNTIQLLPPGIMNENDLPYHQARIPALVPIIHPYDLDKYGGDLTLQFPLVVKLSDMQVANIYPGDIQQKFVIYGINTIERFMVFQNNPWVDVPPIRIPPILPLPLPQLLLRPHSWTNPEASSADRIERRSTIIASWALNGNPFVDFIRGELSTHDYSNQYMMFSPNNFAIKTFDSVDTHHFYSICIEPATRGCAVTCHVLLNPADLVTINGIIAALVGGGGGAITLDAFLTRIEANPVHALSNRIGVPIIRNFIAGRVNI